MEKSLNQAIYLLGSQKALADAIGVSPKTIWAWVSRKAVPAEHCPEIEKATAGAVRCEDLRPDVDWAYLRGSKGTHESSASSSVSTRDLQTGHS
ncbi:helix-turn-helix domain-containing protein [Flavobacterium sp.]|jgi:DNA-binding transcriptional regulator YdaS (Cro superfamily)|uniref:helix-turn-helix domain-containing protein n=1 Tax=Flavobacterium sp. TaxID=239 RepID=UPI0037BFDFDB